MNEDFSRFRDPVRNEPLRVEGDILISVDGSSYPIVDSIPRFVSADNYAADFGLQWNRFPETQLDSHTGLTLSEDRLTECFGCPLTEIKGKRVLEAGSGAGRFSEVLLKYGAVLDSFDYSAAVAANAKNNSQDSFALAQADIRSIPFPRGSYDFVVCIGVLQHTPNTEQSIAKLWEMVVPGGKLIIDHYAWNVWLRLPPPIGDAEKLYRFFVLRLRPSKRFTAVKSLVDFWFPVHWATRKSRLARRILNRVSGIHFYFLDFDLKTRERYYEWSLLDTHDGMTDAFKRYRNVASIRKALEQIGAEGIVVRKGGNGVEATCRKPN